VSGVSGASGGGGTGGSSSNPSCWTLSLNDDVQTIECLGIDGWNKLEVDPGSPSTSISTAYESGKVCFSGSRASDGWAVYNFSFNLDERDPWDAAARGVGGFALEVTGDSRPPRIDFKYDGGDGEFCRTLSPVTSLEIPFASTHPGCLATGSVPDPTQLQVIRLDILPAQAAYAIDFCVQLRAIP
jgi:hypothetical protein